MIQLLRQLGLAATTALQHLTDDPVTLLLQISRRLPAGAVSAVAAGVGRVVPEDSFGFPALSASLLAGDRVAMDRRIRHGLAGPATSRQLLCMAEMALAANLPDLADSALERLPDTPKVSSARARRLWYAGDVSAAVESIKGTRLRQRRQRGRMAGEAELLRGFEPVLPKVEFRAVPGRVLHLLTNSLPHTGSGYAQRSHSMMLAQQAEGWQVLAVTRIGYPVQVGKLLARTIDVVDGVTYRRMLPARLASTADGRLQQQAAELLRIALEFKPAVLHTTTHYVNGAVVKAVAESLGIPWVYEVRGQLADTWAASRGAEAVHSERYKMFKAREARIMQAADLVVTLGNEMKSAICAAGVDADRILLAPNAVGGAFELEPMEAGAAKQRLGLDPQATYMGTVSSLVEYEGISDLIEAFDILAPRFPHLRLLIVGDGAALPGLRSQADGSAARDRIVFTGRVPRNDAYYYHQCLDIFVVPRRDLEVTRSVTPLKPVEAMAAGKPVVAARLPALAEIIRDGETGFLVEPENPADLAAKIERLVSLPLLRTQLGRAGRTVVLADRTWTANAQALHRAYTKISESHS